mmetsp:Transcript_1281/g.1871  ORF Transcript_1281/g.1871 Transcript_1281/m.1871 type:complete len:476 (+) Transcript_1281:630-2057(+)
MSFMLDSSTSAYRQGQHVLLPDGRSVGVLLGRVRADAKGRTDRFFHFENTGVIQLSQLSQGKRLTRSQLKKECHKGMFEEVQGLWHVKVEGFSKMTSDGLGVPLVVQVSESSLTPVGLANPDSPLYFPLQQTECPLCESPFDGKSVSQIKHPSFPFAICLTCHKTRLAEWKNRRTELCCCCGDGLQVFDSCSECKNKICSKCTLLLGAVNVYDLPSGLCLRCRLNAHRAKQVEVARKYMLSQESNKSHSMGIPHTLKDRVDVLVEIERGNERTTTASGYENLKLIYEDISNEKENGPIPLFKETYIDYANKTLTDDIVTDFELHYKHFEYVGGRMQLSADTKPLDMCEIEPKQGLCFSLQVIVTGRTGGYRVQTMERIPEGSYICDYVGEIKPIETGTNGTKQSVKVSKSTLVDSSKKGNIVHFIPISESTEESSVKAALVRTTESGPVRVALQAMREILPGSHLVLLQSSIVGN